MRDGLLQLLLVALFGVWLVGCETPIWGDGKTEQARQEHARRLAADYGRHWGELVALRAGEMAQLDPRSDRSARSREAREQFDEIVPRETKDEDSR